MQIGGWFRDGADPQTCKATAPGEGLVAFGEQLGLLTAIGMAEPSPAPVVKESLLIGTSEFALTASFVPSTPSDNSRLSATSRRGPVITTTKSEKRKRKTARVVYMLKICQRVKNDAGDGVGTEI